MAEEGGAQADGGNVTGEDAPANLQGQNQSGQNMVALPQRPAHDIRK